MLTRECFAKNPLTGENPQHLTVLIIIAFYPIFTFLIWKIETALLQSGNKSEPVLFETNRVVARNKKYNCEKTELHLATLL